MTDWTKFLGLAAATVAVACAQRSTTAPPPAAEVASGATPGKFV